MKAADEKRVVEILLKIRDAIDGLESEIEDPFDGFYEGGTEALDDDYFSVLRAFGVEIVDDGGGPT